MNFPIRPEAASEHAGKHDALFYTITALTIFFTIGVYVAVLFLALKYNHKNKADRSNAPHGNTKLEIAWSVIPLGMAIAIFAWSTQQFVDLYKVPKDAMQVFVIGKQWMWQIQHTNGIRENNELHVPLGEPVQLTMISQDVIHAFYIPEFRLQWHVVPGRYTSFWFTPTKPGKFHILCAMHCGTQHSEMGGYVYVLPKKEYQEWVAKGGNRFIATPTSMAQAGKQLYERLACGTCHGDKDNERGTTLYGLFGSQRKLKDGSMVVADNAYIRDAIYDPYRHLVTGYDKTMPVYEKSQVSEEQILQLTEYIKTLGQAPATDVVASPPIPASPTPGAER
ncbi:MAG TPA: cytochrome c oxidase subunit II [Fimbriimonadaceae bacterium]|nr:cytochrome c oxidase subunit II [Fimbriimonadaceae bacterium]HRJ95201.1 cytochrome c oxidase subunit II [Fimbriimonadaceae bacterium]